MYTLPEDAEEIGDGTGFYVHAVTIVQPQPATSFALLYQRGTYWQQVPIAEVRWFVPRNLSIWANYHDDMLRNNVYFVGASRTYGAEEASAAGQVMAIAAEFSKVLDEADEPALQKYQERRAARERQEEERREEYRKREAERRAEEAAVREARAKRAEELQEQFQWYLDQNFKLTRDGYRSTVFGTIRSVDRGIMSTISERGVPMRIKLADITMLAIKYDGEKRYTTVYTRKEVRDHAD